MRMGRRGFTLIELLIVVVIIGILATIAMSKFNEARARSAQSTVRASLRDLAIQQEIAHHTTGSYVGDPGPEEFVHTPDVTVSIAAAGPTGWAATATHAAWPGKQCAIWVGDESFKSLAPPATQEGVIDCSQ